jgi:MoaA/NifB/PqqE/SkfB family radical SAM enzyme
MIVYYPWSEKVLNECLTKYDAGEMPTLDLELTAKCTQASCIYCDSRPEVGMRHPNELNFRETEKLLKNGSKLGLQWIYTCGLGEPFEDARLERLVESALALGIRISLFTNGVFINNKKAKWLHDNGVCLILKFDTREQSTFDQILGKTDTATKIYKAVEFLLDAGYTSGCGEGYTDLAFSIVPTTLNFDHISDVVQYARNNNIFPSIGELEQAGRVFENEVYGHLALSPDNINNLKALVERLLWKGYTRPICPAIITGIHIDNVGNCVVDSDTGLSCKWFLLQEPMVKIVGNIRKNDIRLLLDEVRLYRKSRFAENDNGVRYCESKEFTFGGCGGSPRKIIQLARQHL